MKKNLILFNPSSGQKRAIVNIENLETSLIKNKVNYEIIITESEQHLRELIRYHIKPLHLKNLQSILTAGGDSTFTILINELISNNKNVSVGVIPLGSSDDIAREFGIYSLDDAVSAIAHNNFIKMDLGKISDDKNFSYYFPGQANMGIGVFITRYVADFQKNNKIPLVIRKNQAIAGILSMYFALRQKVVPQEFTIRYNDTGRQDHVKTVTDEFVSLVFSKIRYWATGRLFLPGAKTSDGKIHLLMIKKCSFFRILKIMLHAGQGRHIDQKTVQTICSARFLLTAKSPFMIQVDGDIINENGAGKLFNKVQIDVLKDRIEILNNL